MADDTKEDEPRPELIELVRALARARVAREVAQPKEAAPGAIDHFEDDPEDTSAAREAARVRSKIRLRFVRDPASADEPEESQ